MSEESNNSRFFKVFSKRSSLDLAPDVQKSPDTKRSLCGRILWILVFILSSYICSILVWKSVSILSGDPIQITVDEQLSSIAEIPFPAMTICPQKKIKDNINLVTILEAYFKENITAAKQLEFEIVSQIHKMSTYYSEKQPIIRDMNEFISTLLKLSPKLSWTYHIPLVYSNDKNVVITEDGVCTSVNALNPLDIYRNESIINGDRKILESRQSDILKWNRENGYNKTHFKINLIDYYPYRLLQAGSQGGALLTLNQESAKNNTNGYKIIFHSPDEIPNVHTNFLLVPEKELNFISITPKIIKSSSELRNYDISRRNCYFQNERYLQHFKIYTQSNCELECLTNYTLRTCGCVRFHMPRNKSTEVCGSQLLNCMDLANKLLFSNGTDFVCNCLPTCISISYSVESTQAYFDNVSPEQNILSEYLEIVKTHLQVFFKESQFLSWKRSDIHRTTDFLSSFYGFLGIFLGIFALSATEIIYRLSATFYYKVKSRL